METTAQIPQSHKLSKQPLLANSSGRTASSPSNNTFRKGTLHHSRASDNSAESIGWPVSATSANLQHGSWNTDNNCDSTETSFESQVIRLEAQVRKLEDEKQELQIQNHELESQIRAPASQKAVVTKVFQESWEIVRHTPAIVDYYHHQYEATQEDLWTANEKLGNATQRVEALESACLTLKTQSDDQMAYAAWNEAEAAQYVKEQNEEIDYLREDAAASQRELVLVRQQHAAYQCQSRGRLGPAYTNDYKLSDPAQKHAPMSPAPKLGYVKPGIRHRIYENLAESAANPPRVALPEHRQTVVAEGTQSQESGDIFLGGEVKWNGEFGKMLRARLDNAVKAPVLEVANKTWN